MKKSKMQKRTYSALLLTVKEGRNEETNVIKMGSRGSVKHRLEKPLTEQTYPTVFQMSDITT